MQKHKAHVSNDTHTLAAWHAVRTANWRTRVKRKAQVTQMHMSYMLQPHAVLAAKHLIIRDDCSCRNLGMHKYAALMKPTQSAHAHTHESLYSSNFMKLCANKMWHVSREFPQSLELGFFCTRRGDAAPSYTCRDPLCAEQEHSNMFDPNSIGDPN